MQNAAIDILGFDTVKHNQSNTGFVQLADLITLQIDIIHSTCALCYGGIEKAELFRDRFFIHS